MLSSRREGMEEATLVGSSLDFAQHNPVARAAPHAQRLEFPKDVKGPSGLVRHGPKSGGKWATMRKVQTMLQVRARLLGADTRWKRFRGVCRRVARHPLFVNVMLLCILTELTAVLYSGIIFGWCATCISRLAAT